MTNKRVHLAVVAVAALAVSNAVVTTTTESSTAAATSSTAVPFSEQEQPTSNPTTSSTSTAVTAPPPPAVPEVSVGQALAVLGEVVPANWAGVVPAELSVIDGSTSLAVEAPAEIRIGRNHFVSFDKLRFVLAHEWAHHVAFRFGDAAAGFGYGPVGFDAAGEHPAEKWANCVAEALTGSFVGTHGLSRCTPGQLAFVSDFLDAGPR
jgi:hypothetical protein